MPIYAPLVLALSLPLPSMAFLFVSASPPASVVSPCLVHEPVVQVRWLPENSTIRHFGPHLVVPGSDEQSNVSKVFARINCARTRRTYFDNTLRFASMALEIGCSGSSTFISSSPPI